jgi:protein-S-isoprenylcysteine O-methyltransferase Ste14
MHPLPYTWPAAALFWMAFWWAFLSELPFMRRERAAQTAVTDRGSKNLILITTGVSTFFAFFFAGSQPRFAIASFRVPLYVTGIAAIVAGGLLRRHCFRMLGERFTYDVRVDAAQRVVERGAYRYVRHPSYTAGLLLFGGIGAALGNWLSLAISVLLPAAAYSYRIAVEERALVETLGPAYSDYMKRTKRLIPFLL